MSKLQKNGYVIPSMEELWIRWAKPNRYDSEEVVFVKKILQCGLPIEIRKVLIDTLFRETSDVDENILVNEFYLTLNQIEFMKNRGMFFGIHGHSHCWLGEMEEESEIKKEIRLCLDLYKNIINNDKWVINYPYGSYSQKVIEVAKKLGCKAGFSVNVGEIELDKDCIYTFPRMDTNDFYPKSSEF